jgi:TM2 domain-containing membrane protein YozV
MKTKVFFLAAALACANLNPVQAAAVVATEQHSTTQQPSLDLPVQPAPPVKQKLSKKQLRKLKKQNAPEKQMEGSKSWIAAVLLCFFLGTLGIHRFYLGYIWQGVVQLLTLGGFGIWVLIDFIRILIKDLKPKNGEYKD